MVSLPSLWLPILLSAVFVFVASSVIHMVFAYHRNDFLKVPDEDGVMDALRPFAIPPGDYVIPNAGGPSGQRSEEFKAKVARGPLAFFTVLPPSAFSSMGGALFQWFVYSLVVSIFAAYLASRTVDPGAEYIVVFRIAGTVAFAGYSLALAQRSIWYHQRWSTTYKTMLDGFIYALLTAGTLGWLWPGP
jgi:hypothetical protein